MTVRQSLKLDYLHTTLWLEARINVYFVELQNVWLLFNLSPPFFLNIISLQDDARGGNRESPGRHCRTGVERQSQTSGFHSS